MGTEGAPALPWGAEECGPLSGCLSEIWALKVNRQPAGKVSIRAPVGSASIVSALEAKWGGETTIHSTAIHQFP